jgi:molecular chaperone DnaJ
MLHVKPHPIFSRKAENIVMTLPVTFVEATLGADIRVPTLDGEEVTVRLAPGTPNGRTLRVKGRGIKKGSMSGDLLATIDVQVPQKVEGEAAEALKKFAEATSAHNVRLELNAKASQ